MFLVSIALTNLAVVLLYTTTSTSYLLSDSALAECNTLVDPTAGECIEQALRVANLPPGKVVKTGKETLYSVVFGGKDPQGGCLGLFHYSYCLFETACNRCKALPGLPQKVANVKKEQLLAALRCQSNGVPSSGQYNLSLIDCDSEYPSAIEMMTIVVQLKINERLMDDQATSESTFVQTTTVTDNNDLIIIIIVIVVFVVLIIALILIYCFCCKSEEHPEEEEQIEDKKRTPSRKNRSDLGRAALGDAPPPPKNKTAKQSSIPSQSLPLKSEPPVTSKVNPEQPSATSFPSNNEATVILPNTSGIYTPASSESAVNSETPAPAEPAPAPAEPVTPTLETALNTMDETPGALEAVFVPVAKKNEAPLSVDSSDSSKTDAPAASSVVDKLDSANTVELPSAVENSKTEESTKAAPPLVVTSEPSNEAVKTDSYKVSPTSIIEKSSSEKQSEPAQKQVEKSNSTKAEEKIEVSKSSGFSNIPQKLNASVDTEKEKFSSTIDSTNKWNTTAFPSDKSVTPKKVEKSSSDKLRNNPSDLVPQSAIESLKSETAKLEEKGPAPTSIAVKVPNVVKTGKIANVAPPLNSASEKAVQFKTSAPPAEPKTSLKKSDSALSAVDGQLSTTLEKIDSGTSLSSTGSSSITSAPSSQFQ